MSMLTNSLKIFDIHAFTPFLISFHARFRYDIIDVHTNLLSMPENCFEIGCNITKVSQMLIASAV